MKAQESTQPSVSALLIKCLFILCLCLVMAACGGGGGEITLGDGGGAGGGDGGAGGGDGAGGGNGGDGSAGDGGFTFIPDFFGPPPADDVSAFGPVINADDVDFEELEELHPANAGAFEGGPTGTRADTEIDTVIPEDDLAVCRTFHP